MIYLIPTVGLLKVRAPLSFILEKIGAKQVYFRVIQNPVKPVLSCVACQQREFRTAIFPRSVPARFQY